MSDSSDSMESWKTPVVGKSCSRCAVEVAGSSTNDPKGQIQKTVGVSEDPRGARILNERLQDGEPMANGGRETKYKKIAAVEDASDEELGWVTSSRPRTSEFAELCPSE
ncbi:hypothetical protein DVH05_020377 [Phytophthora capsici]|nr:hypothetical protein DVH05_020377 [Phytophthora capsici]